MLNLKKRVAKLEAIARERLAAACAAAAVPEEPVYGPGENGRPDIHALVRQYRRALNPQNVTKTEDYRRLLAYFRRLPFRELMRLYPLLKRRQERARASAQQQREARLNRYQEDEQPSSPAAPPAPAPRREEETKAAPGSTPGGSGKPGGPASEPWRLAWAL